MARPRSGYFVIPAPEAGFLLWVELPHPVNALEVHRRALGLALDRCFHWERSYRASCG
ncbi:hypothetical protein SAMN02744778_04738 [Pantoea sp. GL120224-02]|nr:hypothetical protein [Pantoea sp. GL120224-02]SNY79250.1 hypothetical protein SAMN02744778_04738 [Pantoea sp. GL120224-02]